MAIIISPKCTMLTYLNNQVEIACRYGLNPTELDIYNAVEIYCGQSPYMWKRKPSQIKHDLPYMPDPTTISRNLDKMIEKGALIAVGDMIMLQNAGKMLQNAAENLQNAGKMLQNAAHINNNKNKKRESTPAGGHTHSEIKKEKFIIPTWAEVMDYARKRTNWGGSKEMREQAADEYFTNMAHVGWKYKGEDVSDWHAGVRIFFNQLLRRQDTRTATMAQAGFRPEKREYEQAVAMNERKKEEKAMEAIYTDEDKKELSEMYERLGVKQAARASASSIRMSTGHSPSTNQQNFWGPKKSRS